MRHPNIVEVIAFDLGSAGHSPCLVMERMQESLYDLLCVEGIDMGLVAQTSILRDVSQVCTIRRYLLVDIKKYDAPSHHLTRRCQNPNRR